MKKIVSSLIDRFAIDQIATVVVIYNQKITESISYQSIANKRTGLLLFIIDNSTKADIQQFNLDYCEKSKLNYTSMGINLGISKAYNLAIQEIKNTFPEIRFVITLDQDTLLSADYIDEIHAITNTTDNVLVYCPKVNARSKKLSPRSIYGSLCKGIRKHSSEISVTTAINSGLVWNIDAFDQVQYEEKLFLDMVDFDIFFQLHKLGLSDKISFMNSEIKQEFSGETFSTHENDINRFRLYIRDFDTFCEKWKVSRTYCFYLKLRRSLRLSVGHRSFGFLSALVNHDTT